IEGDGVRKKGQRDIAQGEGEGERIEGSGAETGYGQEHDHQAVAVNERKVERDQSENRSGAQENAPGSEERAQIHSEDGNEHQADVEGGAEPGAVVKTDSYVALQVGEAQRKEAAGQCDYAGAQNHTQDSGNRRVREICGHGTGQSRNHGPWRDGQSGRCGGLAHRGNSYFLVRTVTMAERPGRSWGGKAEWSSEIVTGTRCTTLL